MKRNILEILEETAERFPNKIIYEDINRKSTYQEFINTTKKIGTSLSEKLNKINTPVAIYVDRSVACLEAMMGVTYSGNYFIVLDTKSPKERNDLILGALPNPTLIVEQKNKEKIKDLDFDGEIFIY